MIGLVNSRLKTEDLCGGTREPEHGSIAGFGPTFASLIQASYVRHGSAIPQTTKQANGHVLSIISTRNHTRTGHHRRLEDNAVIMTVIYITE